MATTNHSNSSQSPTDISNGTVLSNNNNIINNNGNGNGNLRSKSSTATTKGSSRAHLDRMIQLRNSKIIELYCVSRLSDLLNIKDSKALNSDMNECLNKNDIMKNIRFQIESLPKVNYFNYPNPSPSLSNVSNSLYPRKSLSTGNITKKNITSNTTTTGNKSRKRSSIALAVSTASSPTPTTVSHQILEKNETHSDLVNFSKSSDDVINKSIISTSPSSLKRKNSASETKDITTTDNKNDNNNKDDDEVLIKKQKRDSSKTNDKQRLLPTLQNNNPPSSAVVAAIAAAKQARSNYYSNLYIPPLKPTPVETKPQYEDSVSNKLREPKTNSSNFYKSEDINVKDIVYLMTKDQVPSKIPHSIPLAELKYMAQTLPLIDLVPRAHKVLTTDIINNALNEARVTVVGSRIEELRRLSLWCLRQPKLFIDPWNNDHTHYTRLLEEAKWMQADFKEGKNYRIAACVTLAQAVMDYWTYGKVCCIKRKPIVHLSDTANAIKEETDTSTPTPETSAAESNPTVLFSSVVSPIIEDDKPGETVADTDNNLIEKTEEIETEASVPRISNSEAEPIVDIAPLTLTESNVDTNVDESLETLTSDVNEKSDISTEKINVVVTSDDKRDGMTSETKEEENGNDNLEQAQISNTEKKLGNVDPESVSQNVTEPPKQVINPNLLNVAPDCAAEISQLSIVSETSTQDDKDIRSKEMYPFKLYISMDDLTTAERNLTKEIPIYMGIDKENDRPNRKDTPFVPISKSMMTLDDDHFFKVIEKQVMNDEQSLNQLSKRRGMFYANRRNHYLRPPAVPSLRYLRNRTPTIWLPEDDKELVKNINAYSYNWELISSQMIHRPTRSYLSNIEIRTPWQCFERFVQLNERFTFNDMKGPRAHSAQQWLIEAHKFQQRQNRRISPLGVGEESIQRGHKRLRWASMFEVMRKTIKKRENAPKPNKSQPRKPLDTKNMKIPTPAEMSQLKAQRDEALRRDVQFRRNVKNRTQQKQFLAAQQAQLQREKVGSRPPNGGSAKDPSSEQSTGKPISDSRISNSIPPIDKNNPEMILILNYTKKILAQNPELPPGMAWKTAENYVKKVKEQQMHLKQQQQQQQQQQSEQSEQVKTPLQTKQQQQRHVVQPQVPSPGNSSAATTQNTLSSPSIQQGHLQPPTMGGSNNANSTKIKSPTPSEILQRFQK